jgi:hypothetical protein
MVIDLEAELTSGSLERCLRAALETRNVGVSALPLLRRLLADRESGDLARVWSLQAAAQLIEADSASVSGIALGALDDPSNSVRAVALQLLEQLKPVGAEPAIAGLLADAAANPTWWADETPTIGATAAAVLRSYGTPEAMRYLRR